MVTDRRGPGASNQFESAAFIRSRAGVEYPDIQYHFLPIAVRYDGARRRATAFRPMSADALALARVRSPCARPARGAP